MAETALHTKNITAGHTKEMTLVKNHAEVSEESAINIILHSNLLNFIIVIIFLIWVIRKVNLSDLIAKKQAEIAEMIKNAIEEKNIKQNQLLVTKTKVSNVKQEVLKIIDEGEQVANNLSDSIMEDAEKQAEDMHKKAVMSVNNEKQVVTCEVRAKITGAAFYIAEEDIKQAIDERLHRKYIDEFINDLDTIQS